MTRCDLFRCRSNKLAVSLMELFSLPTSLIDDPCAPRQRIDCAISHREISYLVGSSRWRPDFSIFPISVYFVSDIFIILLDYRYLDIVIDQRIPIFLSAAQSLRKLLVSSVFLASLAT